MTNVWGVDEPVIKASGEAANGIVFAVRTNSVWGNDNKGMELIKKISEFSGKKIHIGQFTIFQQYVLCFIWQKLWSKQ